MIRVPNFDEWSTYHCRYSIPTVESTSRGFGPGGRLTERIRELAGVLMTQGDYQRVADALLEES